MRKIYFYLLALFILSFVITLPFFKSGYFPTHDGEWAVVRLGAMHRAVLDREIPARWSGNQNFGYGYPLFEFTYPFPYYFGEAFNLAKLGLVNSVKIVFVLSVFFSGIGMFVFLRNIFSEEGALLGSVFYLFAPYRMVNLYVRGSIGESLSLAIFPFLFLVLYKLFRTKKNKYIAFFSLLFGVLLLTHNVTSLVFTPFLLGFCVLLFLEEKQKRLIFKKLFAGFLLGGLLSSFFLIPALLEKKHIALSQIPISDISKHFVSLQDLITSPWRFGAYGTPDSFSPQLGVIHILVFIAGIIILLKQKNRFLRNLGIYVLTSILILLFLMQKVSMSFWKDVPLFSNVDFPWRLLAPSIFLLSIPVASLGNKRLIWIPLLILVIIFNFKFANPQKFIPAINSYYFTNQATTTSNDELMPIWVKIKPTKMYDAKVQNLTGNEKINLKSVSETKVDFETYLSDKRKIQINTIFFPGWTVFVDGKPIKISYDNPKGVITFELDKGPHNVTARFLETNVRLFSDIISLVSFLLVLSLFKLKFK